MLNAASSRLLAPRAVPPEPRRPCTVSTARRLRQGLLAGLCTLAVSAGGAAEPPAPAGAAEPAASAVALIQARTEALTRANAAVVGVRVIAVEDARSIDTLGRLRRGSGVVIGPDGLVLTIGYLLVEADHVDLELGAHRLVPARVVAYDQASGFGLLQPLAPIGIAPVTMGSSAALSDDEPLMIASGGDDGDLSLARMVSRRAFSGYWEYHIDGALFTAPPRTDHSGAALFNADGELMGIGSLVVADAAGPGQPRTPGNMFVPVDLLKPILSELRERGVSRDSRRAWLGVNCVEIEGQVRVLRVTADSPADDAGLQPGDHIVAIDGEPVGALEALYKTLWRSDLSERDVTLHVRRGAAVQPVVVHARDRMTTMRKAQGV